MKEKLLKYLSYLIYGLILIYGFYGCIGTTSARIKEPLAFKSDSTLIIFTPSSNLIFVNFNPAREINGQGEVSVFKYFKENPIHYFGSLYNIDSNNLPFGIRYFPNAEKVWLLELTLVWTNCHNQNCISENFSTFTKEIIQFDKKDDLIFNDIKFTRFKLNPEELEAMSRLEKFK